MDKKGKEIFKEYKWARDAVQLENPHLTKIDMELLSEFDYGAAYTVEMKLGINCRWQEDVMIGSVLAEVRIVSEEDEIVAKGKAIAEGEFHICLKDFDKEEMGKRIELQVVPQLLPFLRSSIANASLMLGIPQVSLPTMDIIRSIRRNR